MRIEVQQIQQPLVTQQHRLQALDRPGQGTAYPVDGSEARRIEQLGPQRVAHQPLAE